MTGYPPKCPQNGPRNHVMSANPMQDLPDAWPGDTATFPNGRVWRLGRDGTTWTLVSSAASTPVAA